MHLRSSTSTTFGCTPAVMCKMWKYHLKSLMDDKEPENERKPIRIDTADLRDELDEGPIMKVRMPGDHEETSIWTEEELLRLAVQENWTAEQVEEIIATGYEANTGEKPEEELRIILVKELRIKLEAIRLLIERNE